MHPSFISLSFLPSVTPALSPPCILPLGACCVRIMWTLSVCPWILMAFKDAALSLERRLEIGDKLKSLRGLCSKSRRNFQKTAVSGCGESVGQAWPLYSYSGFPGIHCTESNAGPQCKTHSMWLQWLECEHDREHSRDRFSVCAKRLRTEVILTESTHRHDFLKSRKYPQKNTHLCMLRNLMYTGSCCQVSIAHCFCHSHSLNMFQHKQTHTLHV